MKNNQWLIPFLVIGFIACASMSEQSRMIQFSETADAFRWALLDGNFRSAARFIDPQIQDSTHDFGQYQNVKIVEYKITQTDIRDNNSRIEQAVDLQYYFLNRNILKTTQMHQVWEYRSMDKRWLLKTELPVFKP